MKKIITLIGIALFVVKAGAQVNLQTGSATFSIPMFNWQDDKSRLNGVVALSYNSGNGLKVSDVASDIGQGWNLIAGGVITRMQIGEPDDQKPYNGNWKIEDIQRYPAGYLYDTASATKGIPQALTRYPIFGDQNHIYKQLNKVAADKEMDYFSFQFNGFSGLFVLDKYNTNQGIFLSDNHMKVWFTRDETMATNQVNSGIRTSINAFYIQDENGLIYKFAQYTTTKVLKTGYCDANKTEAQTAPHFRNGEIYFQSSFDKGDLINPYVINNWYLTEIDDALTGRAIKFTYNIRNINTYAGNSLARYSGGYSIVSFHKSINTALAISGISYPDGHNVYFNYGNPRVDFAGDSSLSSVDIMYQGRYLSRYQLNQSYFIKNRYGTPVSTYQKSVARLCLLSVKQIGVDLKADNQPYIFDYYMGSDNVDDFVPPPFYHIKDVWGYYNGNNSVTYINSSIISLTKPITALNNDEIQGLCFQNQGYGPGIYLNAKPGYAKNGLLKQVIYPTGGTLSYEYQQNMGVLNGTSTYVGGVHVSKTNTTDGGYQNGCANPIVIQYNFVDSAGNSSLWGLEMPMNSMTSYNHYAPEYKYYYYKFPFGSCSYHYQYPGILSREEEPDLSYLQNLMQAIAPALNILSVATTALDVISVIAGGPIGPLIMDIIAGLADIVLTCFTNQSKDSGSMVYYNSDLNASNPLPMQFWRVEVIPNTGGTGKTISEFTRDTDYPLWELSNPAMSMKQRYAYSAYGLPKKVTVLDVNGNKIKQTENVYDFSNAKKTLCNQPAVLVYATGSPSTTCSYTSAKALVIKSSSQRNTDWSDSTRYDVAGAYSTGNYYDANGNLLMRVELYNIYKGRVQLSDSYERMFKPTDQTQYVETHTHYAYDPANYQVSTITTTRSNGDINYKNLTYNTDYYDGSTLTSLTNNNILSVPVSSSVSVQKAGSTTIQYLGEKVTEYGTTSTGDIKPKRTMEQRFAQPTGSMTLYSPTNTSNNSIYKQTQGFSYDGSSNLTGLSDEGNHVVTNIYDYSDKYIVASVINADPAADKPAYTGFETQGYFGGWGISGSYSSANYISSSPVTGANSFNLNSSVSLSASLNTAKPYKLSFWANSNGVNVSAGATLNKSAPAINGFTYYEYDIAQGTASVIVSGSAIIDELRLYPKMARMRTVSYDPLIGKTSECDENNRITYYEYDELGRLRFIKDENKNVLKMYEYNTVSNKQSGCPTVYYNHLITETFTKNNCASGYLGSDTVYTIVPGKYSSAISQADADRQAENEINTYGQSFANANAGCKQLFYNAAHSQSYTTQTCAIGYTGATVNYTVPANKYVSLISQTDADSLAWKEIFANGQAYANLPSNAICVLDTAGNWQVSDSVAQLSCGTGTLAGHRIAYMTDINPNSPTYGTWQWKDAGKDSISCPEPSSCSFTMAYGYDSPGNSISNNGTTTSGYLVFYSNSTMSQGYSYMVAMVNGGCIPSVARTFTASSIGLTLNVTVYPNGQVFVEITGGGSLNANTTISINPFSYNL